MFQYLSNLILNVDVDFADSCDLLNKFYGFSTFSGFIIMTPAINKMDGPGLINTKC